jgi:hypothetical protein
VSSIFEAMTAAVSDSLPVADAGPSVSNHAFASAYVAKSPQFFVSPGFPWTAGCVVVVVTMILVSVRWLCMADVGGSSPSAPARLPSCRVLDVEWSKVDVS